VLRCWRVADNERRVEIEHLQSGSRARVLTISAAAAWISSECGEEVIPGEFPALKIYAIDSTTTD
jgi:hypothetical protein